jgi:hypothetical protein
MMRLLSRSHDARVSVFLSNPKWSTSSISSSNIRIVGRATRTQPTGSAHSTVSYSMTFISSSKRRSGLLR